ncbi:lysosomal alpha-mannosidase isoform X2 [Diabrotica virgifera virgifera]|uniref:Alpha-mannosidase n=1 Tax=Diabrotica virgifera virgifera TaxID=50390 RepID=A0ABM5L385_DIAVI|nr:lysosomal alpha-mannosidase isoform X2 [Diabrotica virgifera virgifera]
MERKRYISFIFLFVSILEVNSDYLDSCATKACSNIEPDKINVHLIPHSHDDVGWLKTIEDYFYGERNDIHNAGVQYVLDSVLQALRQNDKRRLLNDTLGECGRPKVGWQIDPFGHSREQASLFKQMGYDAIFFTRLSQDDRLARKHTQDLEFLWTSNDNFEDSNIFTSIMDSYYAPSDFCWDYLQCNSDAINDDPDSFDFNLDKKVEEFAAHIANYSSYFRTNNILYAMGGDFQYQAAEINYLNIDKLIKGFQTYPEYNKTYNVFYSTPSCYVKAVNPANAQLDVKKDGDFFPYNENNHIFWSGYYTSRSTLKRFERTGNNILQAAQQINAFGKMMNFVDGDQAEENLRSLREAVGTMQHHDAITGTEKERVAKDYSRILTSAIRTTEENIGGIIGKILKKENATDINLPLSTCLLANISVCEDTMKDRSIIVLYNPLPRFVWYDIRVPVQNANFTLTGCYGEEDFEIVKHMKYPLEFNTTSEYELVSHLQLHPMGLKVFYLEKTSNKSVALETKYLSGNKTFTLQKENMKLTYDKTTSKQKLTTSKKTENIVQEFLYYRSNNGSADNITSGAYIFRPESGTQAVLIPEDSDEVGYIQGNIVSEVQQRFGKYVVQTMRMMSDSINGVDLEYIEYDWMVGPLDNTTVDTVHSIGKEIVKRYYIEEIKNNKTFYTDSNGRQLIKRIRNDHEFHDDDVEAASSNYYPVTSKISIEDIKSDLKLSILTDRSQGGTSLKDGEVELMLHRRTLKDDYKGVEEPLQEMEFDNYIVVRGSHYLTMGSSGVSKYERILALNKLTQPWVLTADATSEDLSLEQLQKNINFEWTGLQEYDGYRGLDWQVNILNFEPWKDDTYLLRLEHIFSYDEDTEMAEKVTVELKNLFRPYLISSIKELSLGANQEIEADFEDYNYQITLGPMKIRTFLVTFEKQNPKHMDAL